MRRALADYLYEKGKIDDKIIFLTGDLGFEVFDKFKKDFPNRYINAGIAESNMVATAAGLSSAGFKPIVYSIASFMTSRPFEFIKILGSYNNFPLTIIGAGGGLTYSAGGATHHALDDLALMLMIPNVNVFSPAGPIELKMCLEFAQNSSKTSYLRIGKFGEVDLPRINKEVITPNLILEGKKIAILSHGSSSADCLVSARKINQVLPDSVALYHFSSLRPISHGSLQDILNSYSKILVVEDHWPVGGLYQIVLSALQVASRLCTVDRLGPPHEFLEDPLDNLSTKARFNFGESAIISKVNELLERF
jgi:transketolase